MADRYGPGRVLIVGVLTLLALPAAWVLRAPARLARPAGVPAPVRETTRAAVVRAWADPSFRLLALGFSVCGFHVAFLATHLPGVVASCGLPPEVGAWSLAMLGLSFLSTVPPKAGLVARFFGPAHMATRFGMVMVSHQMGGFLGAWLGGKAFETFGNHNWMWAADMALAVAAALVHLPIRGLQPPAPQPLGT